MRRLSMRRFRECMKIDAERAPVMDKMLRLIEAYGRLKENPASQENTRAMEETCSAIGLLEEKNKELAERGGTLWDAVLALDHAELSSPDILKEQREVALGIEWLDRIKKRLARDLLAWDSRVESLIAISDLDLELWHRKAELDTSQERYRWARAKAIAGEK